MPSYSFEIIDEDGDEVQHVLPGKYGVCTRCEGTGKHDHPAFSNGIVSSEWAEMDDDDRRSYMRGDYNVTCEQCGGKRVVVLPDEEVISCEQRAALAVHWQNLAEIAQDRAQERRNLALGIEY